MRDEVFKPGRGRPARQLHVLRTCRRGTKDISKERERKKKKRKEEEDEEAMQHGGYERQPVAESGLAAGSSSAGTLSLFAVL